jgi:hypothetical protein
MITCILSQYQLLTLKNHSKIFDNLFQLGAHDKMVTALSGQLQ